MQIDDGRHDWSTGDRSAEAELAAPEQVERRWRPEGLRTRRQRRISLGARHAKVLELLVTERPLPEVLQALVLSVEGEVEGLICSVLLLDDDKRHLRHGAAPSLPYAYVRAVDGLAIGPRVGSCGTAAYEGRCVVAEDIATDPRWVPYRALAMGHGLRACWSLPVLGSSGEVLGTLAMYYRTPRKPTATERELADLAARIASLAIEQRRSQQLLRSSEGRLRSIIETMSDGLWIVDQEGRTTFANRQLTAMLGCPEQDMPGRSLLSFIDQPRHDEVRRVLLHPEQELMTVPELEFRRVDGGSLWGHVGLRVVRGEDGSRQGVLITLTDITDCRRDRLELARHRDQLEQLVEERTRELRAARQAAEGRMERVDAPADKPGRQGDDREP